MKRTLQATAIVLGCWVGAFVSLVAYSHIANDPDLRGEGWGLILGWCLLAGYILRGRAP